MLKNVIAVIGSTGVGKSKLAVELAKSLHGEIINADAMQIYKGFNIITNKVTETEKENIPHHILDCVDIDQEYTVVDFEQATLRAIADIHARNKLPILVGGTHYYVQAVLWRQSLVASPDSQSRSPSPLPNSSSVNPTFGYDVTQLQQMDNTGLYRLLQRVDPTMAQMWHPNDRRKLLRSLEVYTQTGRRHSEWIRESQRSTAEEQRLRFRTCIFWVHAHAQNLNPRLDQRVDDMVRRGLYQEIRTLLTYRNQSDPENAQTLPGDWGDYTRGIKQAIGLKEFEPLFQQLDRLGIQDPAHPKVTALRDECLERMKIATRQYAKRQRSWIKNQMIPLYLAQQPSRPSATGEVPSAGFYLLDVNRLDQWHQLVGQQGIDIARQFVQGKTELPDPVVVYSEAAQYLDPKTEDPYGRDIDQWKKYRCFECSEASITGEVFLNGPKEWEEHQRSRRHRRALRWLKKSQALRYNAAYQLAQKRRRDRDDASS
ncbi:tRNA dimethylallyltransferase, mitochondrial [Dispira simplex]|nr:tRNA dimethylallyltransferase, mitochondrial [Dispira simplex]